MPPAGTPPAPLPPTGQQAPQKKSPLAQPMLHGRVALQFPRPTRHTIQHNHEASNSAPNPLPNQVPFYSNCQRHILPAWPHVSTPPPRHVNKRQHSRANMRTDDSEALATGQEATASQTQPDRPSKTVANPHNFKTTVPAGARPSNRSPAGATRLTAVAVAPPSSQHERFKKRTE